MRKTCAQTGDDVCVTTYAAGAIFSACGKVAFLYARIAQAVRSTFHSAFGYFSSVPGPVIPTFHTPYICKQKIKWIPNTRYVSGEL